MPFVVSCSSVSDGIPADPGSVETSTPADSPVATAIVAPMLGRECHASSASDPLGPANPSHNALGSVAGDGFFPLLAPSSVENFAAQHNGLRAVFPSAAESAASGLGQGVIRVALPRAVVQFPSLASSPAIFALDGGEPVFTFRVRNALDVRVQTARGLVVYPEALGSRAHLLHRPTPEGTEDYVLLDDSRGLHELEYEVELGKSITGLRLVSNTLEFLDKAGDPKARVAPPTVTDADCLTAAATLDVEGCAFDTDPAPPWDRTIPAPGAPSCTLRVRWVDEGLRYPLLVDPTWETTVGNLGHARAGHALVALPNTFFLAFGGGDNTGPVAASEVFNPRTKSWAATGTMVAGRTEFSHATLRDGRILAVGGYNAQRKALGSAELYNPQTGKWSATGSLATARADAGAAILPSGKVLVAGGLQAVTQLPSQLYQFVATAASEVYTPAKGTWAKVAPMSVPRYAHTVTALANGKVLAAGGLAGGTRPQKVWATSERFVEGTSTWGGLARMPVPRAYHTATELPKYSNDELSQTGGQVALIGGAQDDVQSFTLGTGAQYDEARNSWSTADASAPRGATANGYFYASKLNQYPSRYPPVPPSFGHNFVTTRIVLVGGVDPGSFPSSEIRVYDMWDDSSYVAGYLFAFGGRTGHAAAYSGANLIVAGGSVPPDLGRPRTTILKKTEIYRIPPVSPLPGSPTPQELLARRGAQAPPDFGGCGATACVPVDVSPFLNWATGSLTPQRAEAQAIIDRTAILGDAPEVCDQLFADFKNFRGSEIGRGLVTLGIMGSFRVEHCVELLKTVVAEPPGTEGPTVLGVPASRGRELMYKMKAIDGVAYMTRYDYYVLYQVKFHPEKAVRLRAIHAYLWNHPPGVTCVLGDEVTPHSCTPRPPTWEYLGSADARAQVRGYALPGEEVAMDTPQKGGLAEADRVPPDVFNARMKDFFTQHPAPRP